MHGSVNIVTDDPEIQALKGFIYSLSFTRRKGLSSTHLKVIMGVEMLCRVMQKKKYPRAADIAKVIHLKPAEFKDELRELVEARFLHEIIPTFGDLSNTTYKMGPMGGSMMRRVFER